MAALGSEAADAEAALPPSACPLLAEDIGSAGEDLSLKCGVCV